MKPILCLTLVLSTFLLIACQPADPVREATAKLKPAIDAYVYAWNTGKVDTLNNFFDPQVVRYEWTNQTASLDSLKQLITSERIMFPDFKVTVDEELYVGNHAVLRWTVSGTNTGPGGFPPTGKSFKQPGLSLYRFVDGKLVEERAETDGLNFFQQLGFKLTPPSR